MGNQKQSKRRFIVEKKLVDGKVYLVARRIAPDARGRYKSLGKQAKEKPTSKDKGVVAVKTGIGFGKPGHMPLDISPKAGARFSTSKNIASFLQALSDDGEAQTTRTLLSDPLDSALANQISCLIGDESSPNEIQASDLIDIVDSFNEFSKAVFAIYEVEGELTVKVAPFQRGCFVINFVIDVALYLDPSSTNALEIATNATHIATDIVQTICAVIGLLASASPKSTQVSNGGESPNDSKQELMAKQACENPHAFKHCNDLIESTMAAAGDASKVEFRWISTPQGIESSIIIERESARDQPRDVVNDGSVG